MKSKKKQPIKKIYQSKIKNSNWKNETQTWKKKINGDEIIKKKVNFKIISIKNNKQLKEYRSNLRHEKIKEWNWKQFSNWNNLFK